ncbi:MAG: type IV secretory system conjugative DNA transfer family protein [Eubacterium sp.]|nr:type IV secretory system conjugative DNA transfer family protein [Eubacterium sp.]
MIENVQEKIKSFKEKPVKSQIIIALPYAVMIFLVSRMAELYRLCNGNLTKCMNNIAYIYKVFPRFTLHDLVIGIPAGVILVLMFKWYNKIHGKNERLGEEYGSARWGTAEDIAPFIDKDPYNNIILSQTERLSMKARMPKFNLNRNKHVAVYGGSGSGKTYGFVKPNLYQLHSSYVLTDPNGLVC